MKKIKIYLIARISQDAHNWNNKMCDSLDVARFDIFKPQEHNPWNWQHEKFSKNVFDVDLLAIKNSHIGLCLPEFGKDCSWECGWYSNSQKPLVVFVKNQIGWLRDWMIKGGLDYVITDEQKTYETLTCDPILKHKKIILITNIKQLSGVLEKIYKRNYKNKIFSHILNLRPYSWIDVILIGYLAKFSAIKELIFEWHDMYFIACLLFMWFFFNSILEMKHGYSYRGNDTIDIATIYFILALIVGFATKTVSLVFIFTSALLVFIYLQKNTNNILGNFSFIIRGLIQSSYFFFVLLIYAKSISLNLAAIGFMIFLVSAVRSLVGDIRDIKHNQKDGKKTFPVTFGATNAKLAGLLLVILIIVIGAGSLNVYKIFLPIILFEIGLFVNKNGYFQHQLAIITTSFFTINLIAMFTRQNILFFNLIFLGIWLNLVFYPLLTRKSNPVFVELK